MIEIALTNGYKTVVDDVDRDLVSYRWVALNASGHTNHENRYVYAVRYKDNKAILLHRVILERKVGNKLPKRIKTDHVNHDTLDNRRDNLRAATHSQNIANSKRSLGAKSPYRGVELRDSGKWRAQIKIGGKMIHLGTFDTPEDAAIAWNNAALARHGEFARLNDV